MTAYDLQLDDAVRQIREHGAKSVLIQLPDGLKPRADKIQERLQKECPGVRVAFWANSAFGACDVPLHVKGYDLLLAFGHSQWRS